MKKMNLALAMLALFGAFAAATASADWQEENDYDYDYGRGRDGRGDWGRGRHGRPIPPPPYRQDLCSGTYVGSYSNGKSAVMSFVRTGYQTVNVTVQLGGREFYSASGSCDQRGLQAQVVFTLHGHGIVHRGYISESYGRATLQGAQDGGFAFNLSR